MIGARSGTCGDLLDRQPTEESKLHELALTRVPFRKPLQREIERDDVDGQGLASRVAVLERHPIAGAALQRLTRSRVIDQDAPHQVRGDGKELRAVLPLDLALVDELQIRLVDQGGGRQGVIGPFALKVAARQPA